MEGQALKDGKARVHRYLTGSLTEMGMVRPRNRTVDQHQAFLAQLEARLAYMTADALEALAEVVMTHPAGAEKNVWPSEIMILGWARRLQEPPASVSRLVRTYLQSGAGRAAQEGGYLVELFAYLRKFGTPPNSTPYQSR